MAPGALCDYNLDFIRFEVSLFIAFDKFVHVIFYFSYFTSSTVFFIGFVFKRLGHSIGPAYVGPVRCPSRLRRFLPEK